MHGLGKPSLFGFSSLLFLLRALTAGEPFPRHEGAATVTNEGEGEGRLLLLLPLVGEGGYALQSVAERTCSRRDPSL